MKKFVLNFFLALPVICMLSSFSSVNDGKGNSNVHVTVIARGTTEASHLTEYGYFDGLLYYKITSNSKNEVAVVKAESSAIDVEIPSQVIIDGKTYTCTRIDDKAFMSLKKMEYVSIPNSITTIGEKAFYNCIGLTSVTIPNSVTSIGSDAFRECSGLASITIPNSVTSIGSAAFDGCSGLTSITIPNSVTYIGSSAFSDCNGLTSITIPNSVTSIGDATFAYCSGLTSVTIPSSVTSIGMFAFYKCSGLTSVTIPNNVTSIGEGAFNSCKNIIEITSLIEEPFRVGSQYMPTFSESTFKNAILYVPVGTVNKYKSTDDWKNFAHILEIGQIGGEIGEEFESDGIKYKIGENSTVSVIYNYKEYSGDVVIPDYVSYLRATYKVTSIGLGAFEACSDLISVAIPNSITSISTNVFDNCINLISIKVESGNKTYDSRNNCNAIIESSSNTLLYGCKSTIIPYSVTSIANGAFYNCCGLTSITIPNSVTSIAEGAFYKSSDLISVTIPNSVTFIGNHAFSGCSGLTSITIPNSVTFIGYHAFNGCSGLTSVTIPNSVTSIEVGTFSGCSGLTSITIPNSVTSIGTATFQDCSSLASITIPNSVTYIGDRAFKNCTSLKDCYVWAENVPSTNSSLFSGISNIEEATLHVPAASIDIYKQTDPWSGFGWIIPLTDDDPNPTSMKGIMQSDNLNGEYYNLSGRKVNNPKKGLYIKNGKKVVLK